MAIASTYYFKDYISVSRSGEISGSGANPYFWFQPNNAKFSDNTWATLATNGFGGFTKNGVTPYLAGYGISNDISGIPSDATVEGLILRIEKVPATGFTSGGYPGKIDIYDDLIQLFDNGQMIGNNKSTNTLWNSSETYASYGSPNDTWGATLTPSVLNSGGFGVSIGATVDVNTSLIYNNVTGIDHVELTVFYSLPGGGQTIYPLPVFTQEKTGQHKLIRTIHHRSIIDRETIGRPNLLRYIYPNSITERDSVGRPGLARIIRPNGIASQERLLSSNRLTTSASINPRSIKSEELITRNIKFFNRFYDKLDDYNVWETQSDTGDFTWDSTYIWELIPNAKSLRRIGSPLRTNKFSTSSYKFIFYTSDTLYFSGFVYLANSPNYGGLGFCIQEDLNAGYYAVIDTRNGSGGSSTHSFRLMRVTRSGGTNTFTNLASYNLNGLISEDLWFRIIIEVSSSGNITAKLYRDNGSTIVSAATLSATDTTFNQGYYGLSAFSEAGFDNLTNITAQFSNIDQSIFSQEKMTSPQLNVGASVISLNNRSIQSQEQISRPTSKIFINQIPINKEFSTSNHLIIPGTTTILGNSIESKELLTTQNNIIYSGLIYNMVLTFTGNNPIHEISSGSVNILPNVMFKSGYFNQNRIVSIISPSSIFDESLLLSNKLISNINPRSIIDTFILQRPTFNNIIKPSILFSQDVVKIQSLTININPFAINKLFSFGDNNNLSSEAYILQNEILNQSLISKHELSKTIIEILPISIQSSEKLSTHIIESIIHPRAIQSNELINIQSLNYIIITKNLFKNDFSLGIHQINTSKNLIVNNFDSFEKLSLHELKKDIKIIQPLNFPSLENINTHSLISLIYPRTIVDEIGKILTIDKVSASNIIHPLNFNSEELLQSPLIIPGMAIIYPLFVNDQQKMGQLVTLTTDQIIFLNSIYDLLPGYQPPITEGPIGIHNLQAINIIAPDSIISEETIPLHVLYAIAYINPYPFIDPDSIYNLQLKYFDPTTLQPVPFPGTIDGWYLLPYTIESHLNFRKTS